MPAQETYLSSLRELLQQDKADPDLVRRLGVSPFIQEHELARASYALLCQREGLKPLPLKLSQTTSGAVPLFSRGFFPWGGLPYPKEHAQLGVLIQSLGEKEIAHKMGEWQRATLDHNSRPITSLFSQEKGGSDAQLEDANRAFFQTFEQSPQLPSHFVDKSLGLVRKCSEEQTVLCVGSGCKSGMGAFLKGGGGILNYGPQISSIGDCSGFGLAGRAQNFHTEEEFFLCYQCRLAAPHERNTGFPNLQDSGYSALWMYTQQTFRNNTLLTDCRFEGLRPLSEVSFVFFGKGEGCVVAKSHRLTPRSLDRYQGPAQPFEIEGVCVEARKGLGQMQIIPLAGDESFWGADFLIAFHVEDKEIQFTLSS